MRSKLTAVLTLSLCIMGASVALADGTTIAYYDMNGDALADVGSIDGVSGINVGFSDVAGRDAATFGNVSDDGTLDGVISFGSPHVAPSSFSISLWVNATNETGPQGIFDFSGDGGDGPQSLFANQPAPNLIGRLDGVGSSNAVINAGSGYDNGTWRFMTMTYDGSLFSMFVDNSLISSGPVTGPVDWDSDQYLGAFNLNGNSATKGLSGAIDDFAIYDGVLGSQQISDLFSGAKDPSDFAAIPEPSSFGLALTALGFMVLRRQPGRTTPVNKR